MRIAHLHYDGLSGASGGLFYDAHVIAGIRATGVTVADVPLPWMGFGYARGIIANALPLPPLGGFDLVLQDEMVHPSMFFRNRRIGVPIVAIVHNLTSTQPGVARPALARAIEGAYLRSLSGIVTVCEHTRREIELVRGSLCPVLVAKPGRDHCDPPVTSRGDRRGPLRVVCAGVVSPHKGVDRLIDAMGDLPSGAASLDIAGSLTASPEYVAGLRAQVASLGLREVVRLHGELDRERLSALLGNSDLFALASDREAYSIAALEALGHGLPVLLPAAGGSNELISDGVEGRLLDPDDCRSWPEAILAFANDNALRDRAARAARARFKAHQTWGDVSTTVLTFCEDVARHHAGR